MNPPAPNRGGLHLDATKFNRCEMLFNDENHFTDFARVEQVVQKRFDKRQGGIAAPHPKRIDVRSPVVAVSDINTPFLETLQFTDLAGPATAFSPTINLTNSSATDEGLARLKQATYFRITGCSFLGTPTGGWNGDISLTVAYRFDDGTAVVLVPIEREIFWGAGVPRYRNLFREGSEGITLKTTIESYDNQRGTILQGTILSIDCFFVWNSGAGQMNVTDFALSLELYT